jgi:hypothetical protein
MCIIAPKLNIDRIYAIRTVRQMIMANFLKNMRFPKKSTTPHKKVVMNPEVMLMDISL